MNSLARGRAVLLDTDLAHAGRALRGRRGVIDRHSSTGGVYVCTCDGHPGAIHAPTCPVQMPLHPHELQALPPLTGPR